MKRRLTPMLTIGVALVLIGSLAYAADRRKQAKRVGQPVDKIQEEESLRAELLDAVADHGKKEHEASEDGKSAGDKPKRKLIQTK